MEIHITLPIKKKWFDMILLGEKKEEYREIKPYWTTRVYKAFSRIYKKRVPLYDYFSDSPYLNIKFINGYGRDKPMFVARCRVLKREGGNTDWGAEPHGKYYVFQIQEILDRRNLK